MNIGEVFDEMQQEYNEKMHRWVPYYRVLNSHFDQSLPLDLNPRRVLDLGAGDGNVTASLLTKYPHADYLLVDASRQMLDQAKKRFKGYAIKTQQAMMQEILFTENSFDIVAASFALHHLTENDKNEIIRSIHQWLCSGGYFCYSDLFIDKSDRDHPAFLKYWESYVRKAEVEGDWEYLYHHYQNYDYPTNLTTQLEWLHQLNFSEIHVAIYEKYWVYIAARK